LALKAHTELLDILDLKPYTITLDVTGRIPRPTVHLSSDPALGPLDIASLLTLGTTQSGFLGGDQTARALIADRSRDLAIQRAMGLTSQQFGRILGTYGINVNAHASDVSEWAGARIRLDKQLTQRMVVVYTTSVGGSVSQRVQVDYRLTDYLSLETQTDENGDSGIDLRFKYRF
jgi:autotransporter translocation and assembly factor TamB